tara:strand:- start:111 stop:518 length:408 start_codon:yes stop_codon:yes gene_type:complete
MLIELFSFTLIPLILILLFLSIVFIQSSLDKVFNWKTNLDFTINTLSSKFPKHLVLLALLFVTFFELVGGFSSLFGIVEICMGSNSLFWTKIGIYSSSLALLILLSGQRISMNYEDAKTIVIYFLVCIAGMMMFN